MSDKTSDASSMPVCNPISKDLHQPVIRLVESHDIPLHFSKDTDAQQHNDKTGFVHYNGIQLILVGPIIIIFFLCMHVIALFMVRNECMRLKRKELHKKACYHLPRSPSELRRNHKKYTL